MIVITGANGKLGSLVLERLLERVPADQVAVSVREPQQAADLAERGVRVRHADFAEPGTLAGAFEGADQVLVISAAIRGAEAAAAAHRAAIDAARSAGAQRVLYTSHQAASAGSLFDPARGHATTEQHLAASGGPFTVFRNGFYATTLPRMVAEGLQTGTIVAPADGPVSWTTHEDLAEATAVVLADPDRLDGVAPPLTGQETLDLAAVAAVLTDLTGRTVRRVVQDDDEWKAAQVARGVPAPAAEFMLGMFLASRRGEFDVVDPLLPELLGRPVTPLPAFLERALL